MSLFLCNWMCSDNIKQMRKSNNTTLVALNDLISQLQNLVMAQLVNKGQKDNGLDSEPCSSSLSKEEEEKKKEKGEPALNLMACCQDL
ncbi:hypothetical protein QOT17_020783 [Balamuthia mandrillaris]